LFFAAVPQNRDPAHDKWHRLPSIEDLRAETANRGNTAVVTEREKVAVLIDFTFQNQFGDSEEFAQYCYRPDGSLAFIHSDLKSYHAGLELVRDAWYSAAGEKSNSSAQTYDLRTRKPSKLPKDFWDMPPPEFLRVKDLPFDVTITRVR